MTVNIDVLLKKAVQMKASDLHIKAGNPPVVRIDGTLKAMPAENRLSPEDTSTIATAVLKEALREQFKRNREIDTSYSVKGLGRFRCNCYVQRGTIVSVFRMIPFNILTIEDLQLPVILNKISLEPRGLILVTGTTGSGKTTTLASMIDYINKNRSYNIITIEDPVEFLHRDNKSIISQRELGTDTASFAKALRSSLRQDPDVILVGEMRDFETIQTALIAAETGHLVLSTLHTADTVETVNRVISVFPPYQQQQVRTQLAAVLRSIVSMRLVPRADGAGRVPAVEVLIATAIIKSCIEDPDKTRLIHDYIADGVSQYGMQTFDQSLLDLFQKGLISYEDAVIRATNADDFALKVKGVQSTQDVYKMDAADTEKSGKTASPEIERFSS